MKKTKISMTLAPALFALIAAAGCSKFLDINKDPDSPTEAQVSKLLTFSQTYMAESFGSSNFIGDGLAVYVHQVSMRESPNGYGMTSDANGITNSWRYLNTYVLKDLNEIITLATADGDMRYAGIAKTLKAYTFANMVDLWGNIPYTEAGSIDNLHPRADKDEDIYNACLLLLDEAIADIRSAQAENPHKPAADDLIYRGDTAKWIAAAKTIQLRMLVNTRLVKSKITNWQQRLDALVAENRFITSASDFEFMYNKNSAPADQRHPEFVDSYGGTQLTDFISPWFYEIMKGKTLNVTNNPLQGIEDPRCPYYWVNQITVTGAAANPTDYRDGAFVSIWFGGLGTEVANNNSVAGAMLGIYPCGGKYDNGQVKSNKLGTNDGTGAAPHKFITFFDLKFMLAELALSGENVGTARTLFQEGITAAFAHLKRVCTTGDNSAPAIADADRDAYIALVMAKYDAATDDGKLELVMTQKWIADILNAVTQYTDYRRTGYPKLFVPENKSGVSAKSPYKHTAAAEQGEVECRTSVSFVYPKSLPYSKEETERNGTNMPAKNDLQNARVFWDTRTYDYGDQY
jgi:hypothetical protein